MQGMTSKVCVDTTHTHSQLKVKQYHLNATPESGGVRQFQGTGFKWRRAA